MVRQGDDDRIEFIGVAAALVVGEDEFSSVVGKALWAGVNGSARSVDGDEKLVLKIVPFETFDQQFGLPIVVEVAINANKIIHTLVEFRSTNSVLRNLSNLSKVCMPRHRLLRIGSHGLPWI